MSRRAEISRKTKETDITVRLCLDGGDIRIQTGIGFFDHMLTAFALHGGLGLEIMADGDLYVDGHHTVEDVGIVLGQAFAEAIGDKKGIERFAHAYVPMDEALCFAALDVGGRAFLRFEAEFPQQAVGMYDCCLTEEFLRAFCMNAAVTLHIKAEYGSNSHHITEGLYKALGRAVRTAVRITGDSVGSTKGVL